MLKSMTGFGRASGTLHGKKVSIEIRSLNSKGLDLNLRMPSEYKELDPNVRNLIAGKLGRGKIDVSMNIDSIGDSASVSINKELAKKYHHELKELNDQLGGSVDDYLTLILRMPDIYNTDNTTLEQEETNWLMNLLNEAIDKVNAFRCKEGEELTIDFENRINEIRSLLAEVPKYEQERIDLVKDRMVKALSEIEKGSYDDNRLEQEMIFYIEKLDVSEEKMRLSNHLDYFVETMKVEQSGKKLGFISQEIGREINTLGSKSNHADMQKLVIQMKDNLEKIKEQVLNTL